MPDDITQQPTQVSQTVQSPTEAPNPVIAQILNVRPDPSTTGICKKSTDSLYSTAVQSINVAVKIEKR
jgi:hypothetical protein